MFELHKGDCLPYMKSLPDKAFDLIVTDPPYGLGWAGGIIRSAGGLRLPFYRLIWRKDYE